MAEFEVYIPGDGLIDEMGEELTAIESPIWLGTALALSIDIAPTGVVPREGMEGDIPLTVGLTGTDTTLWKDVLGVCGVPAIKCDPLTDGIIWGAEVSKPTGACWTGVWGCDGGPIMVGVLVGVGGCMGMCIWGVIYLGCCCVPIIGRACITPGPIGRCWCHSCDTAWFVAMYWVCCNCCVTRASFSSPSFSAWVFFFFRFRFGLGFSEFCNHKHIVFA